MGLLKVAAIFLLMGMLVAPLAGFVKVTVGGSAVTVNVCGPLVPIAFVTVTFRAPVVAFRAMANVAVIDVLLTTVRLLTVTPVPLTATVDPAAKSVPVSVTFTVCPCVPELGLTEVSVAAPEFTVNACEPLIWLLLVTVTFWAPVGAFAAMVNVAVIDVLLTTVVLLTVTPVPLRLIVDPVAKFVPVRVTGTDVPWMPLLGVIEVSVGLAVPPHPAMKTPSRSAIPRPRDHILTALYFQSADCFILTDISFLHSSVEWA